MEVEQEMTDLESDEFRLFSYAKAADGGNGHHVPVSVILGEGLQHPEHGDNQGLVHWEPVVRGSAYLAGQAPSPG